MNVFQLEKVGYEIQEMHYIEKKKPTKTYLIAFDNHCRKI